MGKNKEDPRKLGMYYSKRVVSSTLRWHTNSQQPLISLLKKGNGLPRESDLLNLNQLYIIFVLYYYYCYLILLFDISLINLRIHFFFLYNHQDVNIY